VDKGKQSFDEVSSKMSKRKVFMLEIASSELPEEEKELNIARLETYHKEQCYKAI